MGIFRNNQKWYRNISVIHWNKAIYSYNKIYITDLHLGRKNLDIIKADRKLNKKVILFDHNESVTELNSYDFVNIIIKDDNGYCCSTTLLYDYLIKKKLLKRSDILDCFCIATKKYDTGQWDYSDEYSRNLAILFDILGPQNYIYIIYDKLKLQTEFYFTEQEANIIQIKKDFIDEKVKYYIQSTKFKKIDGYELGIILTTYEFRNEIAQYLRKNDILNIDAVVLVSVDTASISIRNINPDVNVRPIAEKLGGKGHFGAAGCNITKSNILKILEFILWEEEKLLFFFIFLKFFLKFIWLKNYCKPLPP